MKVDSKAASSLLGSGELLMKSSDYKVRAVRCVWSTRYPGVSAIESIKPTYEY